MPRSVQRRRTCFSIVPGPRRTHISGAAGAHWYGHRVQRPAARLPDLHAGRAGRARWRSTAQALQNLDFFASLERAVNISVSDDTSPEDVGDLTVRRVLTVAALQELRKNCVADAALATRSFVAFPASL
jgi:hypothetical protein